MIEFGQSNASTTPANNGADPANDPSIAKGVTFPITLGVVDAGSNALRAAVAVFRDPTNYEVTESLRFPVRLGHEVFLTGRLAQNTMDEAVQTFSHFRERFESHQIQHVRAVATSATREASNGAEFLDRVHQEAGLDLQPINGAEEARLVYLAVRHRVPLGTTPWLCVDLGGGSVEVSLVDQNGIQWSESHTMGAVRLLEELTTSAADPSRFVTLLEEYAQTLRIPHMGGEAPAGYIATGGNIESLARLAGGAPDAAGVYRLTLDDLHRLIEKLSQMSFRQRIEEWNLRPDRADVVLPAAIIYHRLGQLIDAQEIVVPSVGVRDGLLLDLAHSLTDDDTEGVLDRSTEEAILALGRKYQFDEAHARHVAQLAFSIFDQTHELHESTPRDRQLLQSAALLHEIGSFISRSALHKHSMYLIDNANLPGISPHETHLIAQIARYHRKSLPKPEHTGYQSFSKADRQLIVKLAAILRLADALDREHNQVVTDVRVRIEKSTLQLMVMSNSELLLEAWSLRKRSDLFRSVYKKKVNLEVAVPNYA